MPRMLIPPSGMLTNLEIARAVTALTARTNVIRTDLDNKPSVQDVNTAVSEVVGAAPDALNTLGELGNRLVDEEDAVAVLVGELATKATTTDLNTGLSGKSDTGHTHNLVTTSTAGLMSPEDKAKMNITTSGLTRGRLRWMMRP